MLRQLGLLVVMIFIATASLGQEAAEDVIKTDNVNTSTVDSTATSTTTVKSPPPSAIAPSINSANSDLCTVGISGAVQTQILGISAGKTVRDMNCEKLKNAKTLYDMGMKVAAVSVMCQDPRVFDAMMDAGTPCPYNGMIGEEAKAGWALDNGEKPAEKSEGEKFANDTDKQTAAASGGIAGLLALLLLL